MIKDAHEQYQIEAFLQLRDFIDGHALEGDVKVEYSGGETRLFEVLLIVVDAQHTPGAATFHFDGIKAAVASYIEHGFAAQVGGYGVAEVLPLQRRIITEEVIRRGLDTA